MTLQTLRAWPGQFLHRLKQKLQQPIHMLTRYLQSVRHGFDLHPVQDFTANISKQDILLFAALRNEAPRIPFFLDYYRSLGVRHFLLVDNASDDGFLDTVRDQPDVSVWHTGKSYRAANFGMHWLNHLLRKYGCGHWCLTCDPDEFLVYPHCDQRNLQELSWHLESEGRRSLNCMMLDMYSDKPLRQTFYAPGDDPFAVAPFFDRRGYTQEQGWMREIWTQGGVRRRVFFRENPELAPALNKTPFVKWRWTYSYFLSMHQLVPEWLNEPRSRNHLSTTGCVMHFKYFALMEQKIKEELQRKQHWNDSFEYRQYHASLAVTEQSFMCDLSHRYAGWQDLEEQGLLNRGSWF